MMDVSLIRVDFVSVRWTAPESQARRGPLALDGARPSADAQSPST